MDTVSIPQAPAPIVEPPPREVADPRIYIACPAYGSLVHVPFSVSIIQCLQTLQCIGDLQFFGGDSLVNRARNNLASMFMSGKLSLDAENKPVLVKYDWLLFLDTDLIFQPADVQRLYDLGVKRGPGVYAGTYPLKTIKPKIVFNALPGATVDKDGVVAVREAGTGFMLIHRKVFEQMKAAYPQNDFVADNGDMGGPNGTRHDWFEVGVKRDSSGNNPRFLSEDWFFCQKWADMGGVTLMQTKICANHIGIFTFPPNPQEIIEVAETYKTAFAAHAEREKVAKAA